MRKLALSLFAVLAAVTLVTCGSDDGGGCPGVTCTNCATTCSITCSPGQTEVCIAHPDDSNLRCTYCQ